MRHIGGRFVYARVIGTRFYYARIIGRRCLICAASVERRV
jgi:hypothetical protein